MFTRDARYNWRYTVTPTKPRHGTRNTLQTFALFSRYFRFFSCSPHASLFWPILTSSPFVKIVHSSATWARCETRLWKRVYLSIKACEVFLCFVATVRAGECWGSYTEDEPWKRVGQTTSRSRDQIRTLVSVVSLTSLHDFSEGLMKYNSWDVPECEEVNPV